MLLRMVHAGPRIGLLLTRSLVVSALLHAALRNIGCSVSFFQEIHSVPSNLAGQADKTSGMFCFAGSSITFLINCYLFLIDKTYNTLKMLNTKHSLAQVYCRPLHLDSRFRSLLALLLPLSSFDMCQRKIHTSLRNPPCEANTVGRAEFCEMLKRQHNKCPYIIHRCSVKGIFS